MYTVAVCEDQKDTREEAAALCGEVLTDLEIEHRIAAFSSAEDLETQLLSGERFDLLCLDILMDGESGMEFAKKLRMTDDRTSILFLTGSSEYLKDGYEVRPIQYLLKPVKREEWHGPLKPTCGSITSPRPYPSMSAVGHLFCRLQISFMQKAGSTALFSTRSMASSFCPVL